jgi:hypothetical protein
MTYVDKSEIEAWGSRQESKGAFPLLIAKMIFELSGSKTFFDIPIGSATFIEGWDGIVVCPEASGFVPQDTSLWEFKTNGGKTQADEDYDKRVKESLGFQHDEAVFVFVTSKIWKGKRKWIQSKQKDGIWKDVIAYDSGDLATWLNQTNITFKWFLKQIGRPFFGVSINEFWESWSAGRKIKDVLVKFTPAVITAGRQAESQRIVDFLQSEASRLGVRGGTKEEATAFIIATVLLENIQFKEKFMAKGLILEKIEECRAIKHSQVQLNLLFKLDDKSEVNIAVSKGHHVLIPLGADDDFPSQDIVVLPRMDKDRQVQGLVESGLSKEDAERYSRESATDITIIRRLLEIDLNFFGWENENDIDVLIPALLVGRWNESFEGDKQIIEYLANQPYPSYAEKLSKWLKIESAPLIKIGETWRLTSPLNLWTILSKHIGDKELKAFKTIFDKVLGEINPKMLMPVEERKMASFRGIKSNYSDWCREGITQSLILLSIYGDKFELNSEIICQPWVDQRISELLQNASGDLWSSRNSEMPLLAEASPTSFFDAAYHSLSLGDKPIMKMFIEEDDYIIPTSRHTGLLWALEGLAWDEEYFVDSTRLLAKLAALDEGGRLSNRPINSLREIFKPWHYQTLASIDKRFEALEVIVQDDLQIGWELLSSLISDGQGVAMPTHKMRWRLFEKSFEKYYTQSEINETHSRTLKLLLDYFNFTENNLITLLKKCTSSQILEVDRNLVFDFIDEHLQEIKIIDNSAWHAVRKILSNHRSYPNARWSMPESILGRYDNIYQKLTPNDPLEQIIWMFNDNWPSFPEGINKDKLSGKEQDDLLKEKLTEGVRKMYDDFGFNQIKTSATKVERSWVFGSVSANIISDWDEVISLCDFLETNETKTRSFIENFIKRKSYKIGFTWTFELYEKLQNKGFSGEALGRVFVPIQQKKEVWQFIEKAPEESRKSYWREINPIFWGEPEEEFNYGIDKLISNKRYLSALYTAHFSPKKIKSKKLARLLKLVATRKSEENVQFDSHAATALLKELEYRSDLARQELIKLEWLYIPLLTTYGSIHKPEILNDELSGNPEFFIDVLKLAYKSANEGDPTDSEEISEEARINRGKNAYNLLDSWNKIPGVAAEGRINEERLNDWVNSVREKAKPIGRIKLADMHIGKILAKYPEKEEPWPPESFCSIIDSIDSRSLSSGFSSELFNKRGFSTRAAFEGGNIERVHAKLFHDRAEHFKRSYPITSKILRNLAKEYEQDAKRQDESAERDKLDS